MKTLGNFNKKTLSKTVILASILSLAACASSPEAETIPQAQAPAMAAKPPPVAAATPTKKTSPIEETPSIVAPPVKSEPAITATEAPKPVETQQSTVTPPAATHETKIEKKESATQEQTHTEKHTSHREEGKVSWEKSLGWLKNGNARFQKGFLRKDGQSSKDRAALVGGQHPHAIVLSCSDSRVPPEVVFDQKLGEIFVVRAAGEVLDSSTLASVEYAVAHLGSNLIVVMGHESCGAVKAALGTLGGQDAGSTWLNKLVADIHPRVMSFKGTQPSKGFIAEGWANVQGVAKDLLERSDIIREAAESGTLKIAKGLYHLDSGEVEWKD